MDQVHKRMNETSTVLFSEQLSKTSSHQQNVMEVHFWKPTFYGTDSLEKSTCVFTNVTQCEVSEY